MNCEGEGFRWRERITVYWAKGALFYKLNWHSKVRILATGATHALAKPLTPKQARTYKDLRSVGLTKRDAAQAARDPGVKKGKWGWVCENPESGKLIRMRGQAAKYKTNAVCE